MSTTVRHPWDLPPAECAALQERLRARVVMRWERRAVRIVAGADVHFPSRGRSRAAVVLMSFPDLEILETSCVEAKCSFPYVPGLLSFREIPSILDAWRRLERSPDLLLCDGQGTAHPRGLGLASHLGLVLGIPTIGCAKSHLFGEYEAPGGRRGDSSPLRSPGGQTIGAVLRTRDGTRPLFVSVGHRVSLRKAVSLVLECTPRFRLPEPLRAAHRLAGSPSSR